MRKNLIRYMAMMFIVGMLAAMMPGKVYALGTGEWLGIQGENLNPKGLGAAIIAKENGDAAAMDYIKECNSLHPGAIPPDEIETILDQGYLSGYVDELKALGYISQNYNVGGNTTPVQEETPAPEPVAFTVEDMDETTMWTISEVNYRDGASTDYAKLGSLAKYDEVTVNGVASTGWYRFKLDGDKVAYVSNNYLTSEDPHDRELNIYNEETGTVDTYNFKDEDPEVIDEAVEAIKEEYAAKEPEVEEPEPEPEPVIEDSKPVVEEPEPAAEPEPVKEPRSIYWWLVVIGGVGALLVVCVAVFFLIYNKTSRI